MLMEDAQIELVRPPVLVRRAPTRGRNLRRADKGTPASPITHTGAAGRISGRRLHHRGRDRIVVARSEDRRDGLPEFH